MKQFRFFVLVAPLCLSLVMSPSAQAKSKPKAFNGKTCTIVGTSKSEKLTGTSKSDVICGLGGNDVVNGLGGNDTLDGGSGNDVISGGDGNDAIASGSGNDTAKGGAGNDVISGDSGKDTIDGGANNDTVNGGDGNDEISSGTGADTVNGQAGNDALEGDSGNDAIDGGTGNDSIQGGTGDDQLQGGDGNDSLQGDAGSDGLIGGAGTDTAFGSTAAPSPSEKNLCQFDENDRIKFCGFDQSAPWIESASLSTSSVNTGQGNVAGKDRVIVATLHITDNLMGVKSVNCGYQLENTNTSNVVFRPQRGLSPQVIPDIRTVGYLVSGNAVDGIWACKVTLNANSSKGRYGLTIKVTDKAGNYGYANQTSVEGQNVTWHGDRDSVTADGSALWIEQTGEGDAAAPTVSEVAILRSPPDGETPNRVTVTFHATDDVVGLSSIDRAINCTLWHGSSQRPIRATKVSGSYTNGIWQCVYQSYPPILGKWLLRITVVDEIGNTAVYGGSDADPQTWKIYDSITDDISEVTSGVGVNNYEVQDAGASEDSNAPELVTLENTITNSRRNADGSLSQVDAANNSIDATQGSASINFKLEFNETVPSNNSGGVNAFFPTLVVKGVSKQTGAEYASTCRRFNVDASVWNCRLIVPLGAAAGEIYSEITATDAVGNTATYSGSNCDGSWIVTPDSMAADAEPSTILVADASALQGAWFLNGIP